MLSRLNRIGGNTEGGYSIEKAEVLMNLFVNAQLRNSKLGRGMGVRRNLRRLREQRGVEAHAL